jgi:hypothetical protein
MKKPPNAKEIKEITDRVIAQHRSIFEVYLPDDQIDGALKELDQRLPEVFFTAFKLGIPTEICDNAANILIIEILQNRLKISLPKPGDISDAGLSDVMAYILNLEGENL